MKKIIYLLSFAMFTVCIFFTADVISRSAGTPVDGQGNGYAGGTAESGRTCATAGCHGGTATNRSDLISTNVGNDGWKPDSVYEVTVSVSETGIQRFGFQASAQDDAGDFAGSLNSTGDETQVNGGYITHTSSGNSGSDSKSWTFEWTAPQAGTGEVDFFVAVNLANNNGLSTGDNIVKDQIAISEANVSGMEEELVADLDIYFNQHTNRLQLHAKESQVAGTHYRIYNTAGQMVKSGFASLNGDEQIAVSELTSGLHILQMEGIPSATTKFFKQ